MADWFRNFFKRRVLSPLKNMAIYNINIYVDFDSLISLK